MRKPEAGEARTGDAEVGRGADGERSEAEAVRGAKAPEAASREGEGM